MPSQQPSADYGTRTCRDVEMLCHPNETCHIKHIHIWGVSVPPFCLREDFLLQCLSALNPSPLKKVCNRCGMRSRTWGVWTRGLPELQNPLLPNIEKEKNPQASTTWLGEGKWSRALESYCAYLKNLASVLVMLSSCASHTGDQGDGRDSNLGCSWEVVAQTLHLQKRLGGGSTMSA